jgi:hypothetical protein
MLFVNAQPTELTAAADNLQVIGSSLAARNVAAAAPTTGVLPAYQAISAQAAAIHDMFVNTLGVSAGSYAATEAANAVATG